MTPSDVTEKHVDDTAVGESVDEALKDVDWPEVPSAESITTAVNDKKQIFEIKDRTLRDKFEDRSAVTEIPTADSLAREVAEKQRSYERKDRPLQDAFEKRTIEPEVKKQPAEVPPEKKKITWPEMSSEQMMTPEGELVDFRSCRSMDELMNKLLEMGTIVNSLGQVIPAEDMANSIYKLIYQDIRDFKQADVSVITMRHGLREAVANLIHDYKKSVEFETYGLIDYSAVKSLEDLFTLLRSRNFKRFDPETIITNIKAGKIDALPGPIKLKVMQYNLKLANPQRVPYYPSQREAAIPPQPPVPKKGLWSRVKAVFGR